jgi:tetratricopeptide (TPR) repeat protein
MGEANALASGMLAQTLLYGPNGNVIAIAQGPIEVMNLEANDATVRNGALDRSSSVVGCVWKGAVVEHPPKANIVQPGNAIELLLWGYPDYPPKRANLIATAISAAINRTYPDSAETTETNSVRVSIPDEFMASPIGFAFGEILPREILLKPQYYHESGPIDVRNLFLRHWCKLAPSALLQIESDKSRFELIELAGLDLHEGKLESAAEHLLRYIEAYPNDEIVSALHLHRGLVLLDLEKYDDAMLEFHSVFSGALRLSPSNSEYARTVVEWATSRIAVSYFLKGDFSKAVEQLTLLLSGDRKMQDSQGLRMLLIRSYAKLGNQKALITHATEFLTERPLSPFRSEIQELIQSIGTNDGSSSEGN